MKKIFVFITVCFMQMFLFANISFASSNLQNLFIVKGIEVSQTSYSSSEAKKKALNVARDEAFRVVLNRLLISSDVASRYPSVSAV